MKFYNWSVIFVVFRIFRNFMRVKVFIILIYGLMENSWKFGSWFKFYWLGFCLNRYIYNLVNVLLNYFERRLENLLGFFWAWEEWRN